MDLVIHFLASFPLLELGLKGAGLGQAMNLEWQSGHGGSYTGRVKQVKNSALNMAYGLFIKQVTRFDPHNPFIK